MNTPEILSHIDEEIERLQKAKSLLTGQQTTRRPVSTSAFKPAKKAAPDKKRKMSAEGRARIAAAQKARWAKTKKAV